MDNNYKIENQYQKEVNQYIKDVLGGEVTGSIGDQLAQLMIDNL